MSILWKFRKYDNREDCYEKENKLLLLLLSLTTILMNYTLPFQPAIEERVLVVLHSKHSQADLQKGKEI